MEVTVKSDCIEIGDYWITQDLTGKLWIEKNDGEAMELGEKCKASLANVIDEWFRENM